MGLFTSRKTVFVDSDVLVIGGGFGGCGAAYESRYPMPVPGAGLGGCSVSGREGTGQR